MEALLLNIFSARDPSHFNIYLVEHGLSTTYLPRYGFG